MRNIFYRDYVGIIFLSSRLSPSRVLRLGAHDLGFRVWSSGMRGQVQGLEFRSSSLPGCRVCRAWGLKGSFEVWV